MKITLTLPKEDIECLLGWGRIRESLDYYVQTGMISQARGMAMLNAGQQQAHHYGVEFMFRMLRALPQDLPTDKDAILNFTVEVEK